MSTKTQHLSTGYCLACGAPVSTGRLYCGPTCGKAYREQRPVPQKTEEHVCTPECTKRFGFCIRKHNIERRARWQEDKRYYQVLL